MNDRQILETAIGFRRAIHRHPELGGQEFRTTALIADALRRGGVPHRRLKPTGVLSHWTEGKGPAVALRADLDALPLQETTGLPFASRRAGVMHACGHDAHTAMLLTAALRLRREGLKSSGTVRFLFQPDEEGSGGARQLIREGAMSGVKAVFGVHVNPRLPAGTIGVKPGPLMAGVDRFTVRVRGEGGHGAYPHEGTDAIVMAAQVVNAFQAVVAREIDPVEPVVVTVGTIHGGERFNILPASVVMTGTVRTLSHRWHRAMPRLLKRAAAGVGKTHGGRVEVDYEVLSQPVINDAQMAELACRAAVDAVGPNRVVRLDRPSMGGEDFSEYLAEAPGCFVYLGTGASARTRRPWHHGSFVLHEPSMGAGVDFLTAVARRALKELN